MDAATKLKIIANYGVGYNNIDVDYATKKGIVVCNTPNPVTEPTAEMAFALMHAVARRIHPHADRFIVGGDNAHRRIDLAVQRIEEIRRSL